MKVEKAGIDDIEALVKLRLAYLDEDNGGLDDHDQASIRKDLPGYYMAHIGKDLFVYVIRDGQAIVSCAFLLVIEKPMSPAFINGKTGIILNVYTCPSYRRKGCAGTIMRELINDAKEKNISVLELKSTEDGHALYRSVGFFDDNAKYYHMKWTDR